MSKLYMIGLGGKQTGIHIEIHSLEFVVADQIQDTYLLLDDLWQGQKETLHMDSYTIIEYIPGYDISVEDEPQQSPLKLFAINYGGNVPGECTEYHKIRFLVAEDALKAKRLAKAQMTDEWDMMHVDDVIDVEAVMHGNGHLHLTPSEVIQAPPITWQGFRQIKDYITKG